MPTPPPTGPLVTRDTIAAGLRRLSRKGVADGLASAPIGVSSRRRTAVPGGGRGGLRAGMAGAASPPWGGDPAPARL